VTVDLARNVISIAPLIRLVAIAVTFGQAELMNGAALIKWFTRLMVADVIVSKLKE
jgi:hypothetical protein